MKCYFTFRHYTLITLAILLIVTQACKKKTEVLTILPSLTTNAMANISNTSAGSGGTITDAGSGPILGRGVCWSTLANPTTSDSKTLDGTGTGSYTSQLTGLTPHTTYYVRAFAVNSAGTAYGNQLSFMSTVIAGDAFGGGIVAYVLQPWDTGYIAGEIHGLIITPTDLGTNVQWGCMNTLIGGTSTVLGSGQANTTSIVNGCSESGIAARMCDQLVLGGYSDWYLPSKDELFKVFLNQTAIGWSLYAHYYWTSSETTARLAWSIFFNGGSQSQDNKDNAYEITDVRAVRSF